MGIEPHNLRQMETLFNQSALGIHLLFENSKIAQIMKDCPQDEKDFLSLQTLEKVQDILVALINKRSIVEKLDYLENLDSSSYELMVKAYFRLLDSTIMSKSSVTH